jgi:hypothetical protein
MQKYYSATRAALIVSAAKPCDPRNDLAAVARKGFQLPDLMNGWIN